MIPELREQNTISVALVADEEHWNIVNGPVYPACLMAFRRRYQTSQEEPSRKTNTRGEGLTLETSLPSATSSKPQNTFTTDDDEVREQVHKILSQVFALKVETMQEMGFVWEVDRALARALMSEFIQIQLIVGDNLNTSLQVMHADLEATTNELLRDLDTAAQNSTEPLSANPSRRVALNCFNEMVRLKLALPLAQLDAACEDMEKFLQYGLSQLHAQKELRNLLVNLSDRLAAHQSRVCQIVNS